MSTYASPTVQDLGALKKKLSDDLVRVLNFWLDHSIDEECGGYFNCINHDGTVYDSTKYVWLQCRAVWMFSRLYTNPVLRSLSDTKTSQSLRRRVYMAAKHGIDFITKHVVFIDEQTKLYRCYFSVDRHGNGLSMQRKIFSECFFVMALIAYSCMIYRVYAPLNDRLDNAMISEYLKEADKYLDLAVSVFKHIQVYIQKPELLGFKYTPQHIATEKQLQPLNVPMICLNIIDEFKSLVPVNHAVYQQNIAYFNALARGYIADIVKHVDYKNKCVRENVCVDGSFDDETSNGRMVNPGHAIEAAWFLREYVRKYGDGSNDNENEATMNTLTRNIFEWSFEKGWDTQNGGLYAFCDALNKPTTMLESNMKLWWPINESMITSLLLLRSSMRSGSTMQLQASKDWNMVQLICKYALNALSDTSSDKGGWYGYLRVDSKPELTIKGGPYKGFFHVPRSLMYCVNILDEMITGNHNEKRKSKL